jgi:hypothetical protein
LLIGAVTVHFKAVGGAAELPPERMKLKVRCWLWCWICSPQDVDVDVDVNEDVEVEVDVDFDVDVAMHVDAGVDLHVDNECIAISALQTSTTGGLYKQDVDLNTIGPVNITSASDFWG